MADKKEVLDYLRNRQKAAEIEAKVNGVNLWVLLGAIGIAIWQLLGYDPTVALAAPEPLVRVLLAFEAAFLFSVMCSPSRGIRNELRYSAWRAGDEDTPILIVLEGMWTLVPPVLGMYVIGLEWSIFILGIFGAAATTLGVTEIFHRVRTPSLAAARFPKPAFKMSPKTDAVSDLVISGIYLFVIAAQVKALWTAPTISMQEIRVIALFGVLYILCMVAIRRRRANHSIQWTYELETDVVIGSLSPEGALRRIEHRALGPKLEDLMNKFFDELDAKLAAFESSLEECGKRLGGVREVPREFQAERAARIETATGTVKKILDGVSDDLEELAQYLKKLQERKTDLRVANAIDGLTARKKIYADRLAAARATFDKMKKVAAE